ncbi:hypothetical protein NEMIN01_0688 [Nematocida minor]|uniref:uncharacterized protein n=1 Tax=Nematocida minor TaxID=1912983 RepID=UPI00221ED484|nr:uncharacterized protein NEMIN01_0688 [Nematocida minor]KAI5189825.1 hypothetical protein NEMIN01_0688 [Nematocida minor]
MKEVKLKIKLEEIRKACELTIKTATIESASAKDSLDILRNILDKNIEIEGPFSEKEREGIEDIIKNNMCQYFTYNTYGIRAMDNLNDALKSKDEAAIRYWYISLFNEIVNPNSLIYSPEHGIYRQVDKNKALEDIKIPNSRDSLGTRKYTLLIDNAKFLSFESTLQAISKSLERESHLYTARSISSMNIEKLKKYSLKKACHSLNKLYNTTYKDTGVLLVDYGLNLIHEKYHEIKELAKETKDLKYNDKNRSLIATKLSKVFTEEEDVKVVLSVIRNIEKIKHEKMAQKGMIDTIEYMANNPSLLKQKANSQKLKIQVDLSSFVEEYVSTERGLKEIVNGKKNRISKRLREEKDMLEVRKKDHRQAIQKRKSKKEIENEIYALECAFSKEYIQFLNITDNLQHLSDTSPVQKKHIIKKIEEFGEMRGMELEIVKVEVPEEAEVDEVSDDEIEVDELSDNDMEVDELGRKKVFAPAVKEAKLKIDVREMLQPCIFTNTPGSKVVLEHSAPKEYFSILENMLNENIEIESEQYSKKEKEKILKILKTNIKKYFAYDENGLRFMRALYSVLRHRNVRVIIDCFIRLVNEIIKPNTLIYSPEQGITRENEVSYSIGQNDAATNLSTRTYTLKIDGTKFESLDSLLESATESLDREAFACTVNTINQVGMNMNVLKKYSADKEYYTLDELYTSTYEDTDVLLVDHGLKLISEKQSEIRELVELIENKPVFSSRDSEIVGRINSIFSREELKIAISIENNLQQIKAEKIAQKGLISALKCIANNTALSKDKKKLSTLEIKTDLSNFYEDYLNNAELQSITCRKEQVASEEIDKHEIILGYKKINYEQETEEGKKKDAAYSINALESKVYLLEYDRHKEIALFYDIRDSKQALSSTSPVQKQYMLKKIEEAAKAQNIKIEKIEVPEEKKVPETRRRLTRKLAQTNIVKNSAPNVKEAKLKINVEGILDACQSSKTMKDMYKAREFGSDLANLTVLKNILDRNMEIESENYSEEEREILLNTIKNNIYKYFMYTDHRKETICDLQRALNSENRKIIKSAVIPLIKRLGAPNILIYNPEHGIRMQIDMDETPESIGLIDPDISTRTYTLEIDNTKFASLESLNWSSSESLCREFFCLTKNLYNLGSVNALKKYTSEKEYYTLDELYTKTYEGTDVSLIDYGLNLILEKYYETAVLIKKAKEIEANFNINTYNEIKAEIKELFVQEDLKIAISTINSFEEILEEREICENMVKVVEYMTNNGKVLEQRHNPRKMLEINADLDNFYEDCIVITYLKELVDQGIDDLGKKRRALSESSGIKNAELSRKEAELKEWKDTADPNSQDYERIEKEKMEEIEALQCDINDLDNNLELINWELKREKLRKENINSTQASFKCLPKLRSVQKEYLLRKMKKLGKTHGMNVVVDGVEEKLKELKISDHAELNDAPEEHQIVEMEVDEAPEERKSIISKENRSKLLSIALLFFALMTGKEILSNFSEYTTKNTSADSGGQPPIKKFRDSEPGNTS